MATQIPVKHFFKDVKVVRGKDWIWRNQDGGNGCVGVIKEKGEGKWVEVLWESPQGMKNCEYRIGHDDCYDLYFAEKRDALIQEAMERFPSGCSYKSAADNGYTYKNVKYDMEIPYYFMGDAIAIASGQGLVYADGKWAERIHESDTIPSFTKISSLAGQDLIKECKRRYPVGCKVRDTEGCDTVIEEGHKFVLYTNYSCGIQNVGRGYLYNNGKWAQILHPPTSLETIIQKPKTQTNEKEHNTGCYLPSIDFQVSRTNPIRGIGLESATSKISIGSYNCN